MLERWSLGSEPRGVIEALSAAALRAASIPYAAAVATRNLAFDAGLLRAARVACPVISVGNLTVGGTGKTPMVVEIVRLLAEMGRRPAIVSRGYGRRDASRPLVVSVDGAPLATAEETGDEPLLLSRLAPRARAVVVAAKRADAAQLAVDRFGADVIVLDDGFQHRWLARDCDIVLWDALRPLEAAAPLPRGHLREGLRGLKRAQALVLTRCNLGRHGERALRRLKRLAPHVEAFCAGVAPRSLKKVKTDSATPHLAPESLRGKKTAAFCGLGNPESFWRSLEALGAVLVMRRSLPDHSVLSPGRLEALGTEARASGAELMVTTEKDAVKLPEEIPASPPIFSLNVALDLGGDTDRFRAFLAQSLF